MAAGVDPQHSAHQDQQQPAAPAAPVSYDAFGNPVEQEAAGHDEPAEEAVADDHDYGEDFE